MHYNVTRIQIVTTQGGASQRPSALAGPLFVWCCCVGQAKVNGATIVLENSRTLGDLATYLPARGSEDR